jgi:hypothetical protein
MSTISPTVLQSASVPSMVPTTAPQVAPVLIVVSAMPARRKAMSAVAEVMVTVAAWFWGPMYLMTIIASVSSTATAENTGRTSVPRKGLGGPPCAEANDAARVRTAARVKMRLVMVMVSFRSPLRPWSAG